MKWMSSPGDRDSQGQGQSIQAEGGGPAVIKAKVLEILLLCHSWERISLGPWCPQELKTVVTSLTVGAHGVPWLCAYP